MLKVEGHDTVSKATSKGRLTLVDLAGSERISRSEATGIRLVEAAAINKSLSALGQVSLQIKTLHNCNTIALLIINKPSDHKIIIMTFLILSGICFNKKQRSSYSLSKFQAYLSTSTLHRRRLKGMYVVRGGEGGM